MSCNGVIETGHLPQAAALAPAVRTSRLVSSATAPAKVRDVPSARVALKTYVPGACPPKHARLEVLALLHSHLQSGRVVRELPGPLRRLRPAPAPSPLDLPDPRHDPTSGAYAFSASWSAQTGADLVLVLVLVVDSPHRDRGRRHDPRAANIPTPNETLALRIVDSPPRRPTLPSADSTPTHCRMKPRPEASSPHHSMPGLLL